MLTPYPTPAPHRSSAPPGAGDPAQVLIELGDCHAALDRHDLAATAYHRARQLAPHRIEPLLGLGMLGVRGNDLPGARDAFAAAARLDPAATEPHTGLGVTEQHAGRHRMAFEHYLQALARDGDNLLALLGLFQCAVALNDFSRIIRYLELYLQRHPDDAGVLFCLATLYEKEDRLLAARDALRKALALAPDQHDARALLHRIETILAAERPRPAAALA